MRKQQKSTPEKTNRGKRRKAKFMRSSCNDETKIKVARATKKQAEASREQAEARKSLKKQ